MKHLINSKLRLPLSFLGLVAIAVTFTRCAKDEITPVTSTPTYGNALVDSYDDWKFDKAHSNVEWETAYYGEHALLTGRFNMFDIDLKFDEQNPANSKIEALVQLSAANTGEPGRDKLGGCLNGYLGVQHNGDTLANGQLDPKGINPDSDFATFESIKVERYGDGYLATGNFSFRGVTQTEKMYFKYLGMTETPTSGGTKYMTSFSGEMSILARSVYGVNATSIADKVTIKVNSEFNRTVQ